MREGRARQVPLLRRMVKESIASGAVGGKRFPLEAFVDIVALVLLLFLRGKNGFTREQRVCIAENRDFIFLALCLLRSLRQSFSSDITMSKSRSDSERNSRSRGKQSSASQTAGLQDSSRAALKHIRIGPAGWSYPDWSGYVYPTRRSKGFHEATFLAQFFDTIEINTSFYAPMRADHASQWVERVAANSKFLFTAKLWQKFTHDAIVTPGSITAEDERLVRAGFDVLRGAGKLGAVLLQFPFSFHRTEETTAYLEELLSRFGDYPLAVEVRHASWHDGEIFAILREHRAAFCNIDQPVIGRSLEPSAEVTAPIGYVRLHGRRYDTWFSDDPGVASHERYNYLYSSEELAPWAERIERVAQRARDVFVVTNNHYLGKGVVNALQLVSLLTKGKVNVPEPLRGQYPELEAIASEPPEAPTLFRI